MCLVFKVDPTERASHSVEEGGYDILVHHPEPLDPTPIRASVVRTLTLVKLLSICRSTKTYLHIKIQVEILSTVPPVPRSCASTAKEDQMRDGTRVTASTDGDKDEQRETSPDSQTRETIESLIQQKLCLVVSGD